MLSYYLSDYLTMFSQSQAIFSHIRAPLAAKPLSPFFLVPFISSDIELCRNAL